MQLSLSTFIVIISLLVSILITKTKEENTIIKIPMENSIETTDDNKSKRLKSSPNKFKSRIMEKCSISRANRRVSQPRNSRMTYVKAIVSNPKISPSQHLAEKLARAELKSPKMQETFKKLTAVHAPRESSRKKVAPSEISSSMFIVDSPKKFHDAYKLPRFKGPRKRKRKRHKTGRRNGSRRGSSSRGKGMNSRLRFARQTANSSEKYVEKNSQHRYEKSMDYHPEESLGNLRNYQTFQQDPYGNLNTGINYPGVEDLDTNFQDDSNLLNYGSNYSPIRDQSDDSDIASSMADDNPDFSPSNDQLPSNQFISPVDNSYTNFRNNEYSSDLDARDSLERQNPIRSRQYGFSRSNLLSPDRYGINGGKSVKNHFNGPRIHNNRNFRLPNAFDGRKNNLRDNHDNGTANNFGRNVSTLNPKYPSGSTNISEIDLFMNSSSNNSTKSSAGDHDKTTMSIITTINSGQNSRTRKASRVEKSDVSRDKSIFGGGGNGVTTEMNLQLKGIGEASAVPPETSEKKVRGGKNSKEMEYNSLAMITAAEPQPSAVRSVEYRDTNSVVANETKQVAGQILNKIIDELEDLKIDRNKNDRKEGLPCKLSGSWITTQAGVRIDMLVTNRSVNVSMARLDLPVVILHQSLLNYTWNMTGYAPFRRGGPFSLVATDNHTKSLAVFVGACRVCQGVDTIEGVWSIAREPRDCRDFQMATSIHNDIFRRTQLLSAIKEKQLVTSSTLKYSSTPAISLTKEEYSAFNSGNAKLP